MSFLFGILTFSLLQVIISSGVQSLSTTCQEGWTEYGGNCYWSQPGLLKSWEDAQDHCQSLDSNLVKVETSEENSWLKEFATLSDGPWIGANDRDKEGEWRWISDNSLVTFTDWNHPVQPDNAGNNEDCGHYWSATLWNDHVCTILHGFICEKEEMFSAAKYEVDVNLN